MSSILVPIPQLLGFRNERVSEHDRERILARYLNDVAQTIELLERFSRENVDYVPLPAGPTTGDLLRWDGSSWVKYPDSNFQDQDAALDNLAAAPPFLPTHVGVGGVASGNAGLKDVSGTLAARAGDDSRNADFSGRDITSSRNYIRTVGSGLTASTMQTQGQQPLTKDFNEVAVVANPNDVVTLPSAAQGMMIVVKNNGANNLQIFPASGDSLDAGAADASVTLTAGLAAIFFAINSTVWISLGEIAAV